MSRASLAPPGQRRGRRARSRLSRRLPPAVQRWGSRSPATHPSPTGWAGRAGRAARPASAAEPVSCRSTDVNRSELLLGAPRHLRAGASFRCARLVARRLVPPAPSCDQAPRDSAPAPAGASVPCAPPPTDRTSPERFPKQTLGCVHTHSLTHTHNTQRGAHSGSPALSFGAPRAILSLLLPGGGWVTSPQAREAAQKGDAVRVPWAGGAGHVPGWRRSAGRHWAAGASKGAGPAEGWVRTLGRGRGRGAVEGQPLGSGEGYHCPAPSRASGAASPTPG